jgi:transposase
VIKLGEAIMILDLYRQGLTVSAIARELGIDRKTVRKCIARGLEPPVYGPRKPRQRRIDPFVPYLRERVTAYPGLSARRLWRELRERGYEGGYSAVTDLLREIRPAPLPRFEVRFEALPGDQAQVDFAQFQVQFTNEPAVTRIVWLFSLVLGFSRLIWARFVLHQDMQMVLRCHMHATTQRVVNDAFAEEKVKLNLMPLAPFRAVLKLERRVSHEGMVSVGGNLYSVPDATRKRVVEVHTLADEVRIFEDGALIAAHPVLEGRHQRRVASGHRKVPRSLFKRTAARIRLQQVEGRACVADGATRPGPRL